MVKKTRSKRLGCYFYKSNVLDASFAKTLFGQVKMQFSPWGRGSASWMARAKNGLEKKQRNLRGSKYRTVVAGAGMGGMRSTIHAILTIRCE
jgi:hypothetical protein